MKIDKNRANLTQPKMPEDKKFGRTLGPPDLSCDMKCPQLAVYSRAGMQSRTSSYSCPMPCRCSGVKWQKGGSGFDTGTPVPSKPC